MKIKKEDITAIIDSREKTPLSLDLPTTVGTLVTGDYSVRGLEHVIAVERKSLQDLVSCVGRNRARFEREVQRLLGYPTRLLIVEATWDDIHGGRWRGKVKPIQVVGSLLSYIGRGLPVLMAGSPEFASSYVSHFLLIAANRRLREAESFIAAVEHASKSRK